MVCCFFVIGFVFSLGSSLELPFTNRRLLLPYWIFEQLPVLKTFRAPARRLVQLCWISLCILSAVAIKNIFSNRPSHFRKNNHSGHVGPLFSCGEMDVPAVATRFTILPNGAAYRMIKADLRSFGVLELPVAIDRNGTITINAQMFMLGQPLHEKPLVLARPPRHTVDSIDLCENNRVFYELTHPYALVELYDQPSLRPRLDELRRTARNVLRSKSVGYVIFHTKEKLILFKSNHECVRKISDRSVRFTADGGRIRSGCL